jgi:hypothetical protein
MKIIQMLIVKVSSVLIAQSLRGVEEFYEYVSYF